MSWVDSSEPPFLILHWHFGQVSSKQDVGEFRGCTGQDAGVEVEARSLTLNMRSLAQSLSSLGKCAIIAGYRHFPCWSLPMQ